MNDVLDRYNYQLIRSKRRTLSLEIETSGELIIRAPQRMALRDIQQFINEKHIWIIKHQARLQQRATQQLITPEYKSGSTFWYLGKQYELTTSNNFSGLFDLIDDTFQIHQANIAHAKAFLFAWYKRRAQQLIPERLQKIAQEFDFRYNSVKINDAKKRWGSCSQSGNINFSWRLILIPLSVIDYVIKHELAHLKEMNHSKKFWRIVAILDSEYKKHKNELHDFENLLQFV